MPAIVAAEYKTPPAEVTANVSLYIAWALWIVTVIAVARLTWIGGKFGYQRWSGQVTESEPVAEIIGLIIGGIIAGTAASWATFMVGR